MKNSKKIIYFSITLILTNGFFGFDLKRVSASTTDGTVDSTYKYAWGENIGWINLGTAEGNVHITDSALTGYAWGENIGWINLNPAYGGVTNDGAGNLSGYAWSENTGWINFNPAYGGVTINSSGEFLGYAWGENIGWIVFNCATANSCATVDYKIKTDWRPQSARPSGGGGLPPDAYNPPALPPSTPENPEGKFSVSINDNAAQTNTPDVILKLAAGSDAKRMAISNTADFLNASQIPYQEKMEWELPPISNDEFLISNQAPISNNQASKQGVKRTVYAKFYTQYGVSSLVVSDSIILAVSLPQPASESKPAPEIPEDKSSPETADNQKIPSAIKPISGLSPKEASPPAPSAQLPEQPPAPIPSKPAVEEPKTPPSSSEPSEPPMPAEPVQPESTKEITSKSSEQPFFAGGFWQSVKAAFKNISSAITDGFNNAGKKIASLFNQGQNSFAIFIRDAKILESEIKIAVFESSNPLQISDVKVISVSSTSVEIIWQTNHKATSKVNYGLSRIYDGEKQDSKKVKSHSVILTNLNPDTTYHYEVISQNGSYVYDADRTFTTARE